MTQLVTILKCCSVTTKISKAGLRLVIFTNPSFYVVYFYSLGFVVSGPSRLTMSCLIKWVCVCVLSNIYEFYACPLTQIHLISLSTKHHQTHTLKVLEPEN